MKRAQLLVATCLLSIAQLNANDATLQRTLGNITGKVEDTNKLQLERINQPLCIFRTHSSKPTVTTFDPRKNEIKTLTCLPYNEKTKSFTDAKNRNNLAHLKTIRSKIFDLEGGSKIDKHFAGDRNAPVAAFLEDACKTLSLISRDGYEGTALIDEYEAGMPMKWVLASAQDLNGIQKYFEKHLTTTEPTNKPLLLLELLDASKEVSDENITFLTNHFQLIDPTDATFKKFFNASNEAYLDAAANARDIKRYVGESFGEEIFRKFEEAHHNLKIRDVIVFGAGIVGTYAYNKFYNSKIKPKVDEKIEKTENFLSKYEKAFLIGGGLCAGGIVAKVLYDRAQKSNNDEFYEEPSAIDQEIDQEIEDILEDALDA